MLSFTADNPWQTPVHWGILRRMRLFQTQRQLVTSLKGSAEITSTATRWPNCHVVRLMKNGQGNLRSFVPLSEAMNGSTVYPVLPTSLLFQIWSCQTLQLITVVGRNKSKNFHLTLRLLHGWNPTYLSSVFSWHLSFVHSALPLFFHLVCWTMLLDAFGILHLTFLQPELLSHKLPTWHPPQPDPPFLS